jgi:hypothetical protein
MAMPEGVDPHMPIAEFCELLKKDGLPRTDELCTLLQGVFLNSVQALRGFPSLSLLVFPMFETSDMLGKLQAEGYLCAIRVLVVDMPAPVQL